MKKYDIALKQIRLQSELQNAGFNIVTCGNCGTILIHECGDETIDCFCGQNMDLSNCPDYWCEGLELNEEFKD